MSIQYRSIVTIFKSYDDIRKKFQMIKQKSNGKLNMPSEIQNELQT